MGGERERRIKQAGGWKEDDDDEGATPFSGPTFVALSLTFRVVFEGDSRRGPCASPGFVFVVV
jgi:hypothetical protein